MPFRISRFVYLLDCLFVFLWIAGHTWCVHARDHTQDFMPTRQALYQTTPTFQKCLIACLELTLRIPSMSNLFKRGNWGTKQASKVSLRVNWVHIFKYSTSSPCGLQEMAGRCNSQEEELGVTQWVNHLPLKCEDLIGIPRAHVNPDMIVQATLIQNSYTEMGNEDRITHSACHT